MNNTSKVLNVAIHALGLLSFATISKDTISTLWRYFLRPTCNIKKLYNTSNVLTKHNINTWVIITGGSEGIGFELAKIFAKQGLSIILIARDSKKLISAQNELLKDFKGIEVKVFSMDASNTDENVLNEFKSFIESDFISILVNNVGVHNEIPTNVVEMLSYEVRRIINVNCTFQVEFTSLIIPKLRQTAAVTRKKSLIMNISSLTSKMAMPMLSLYAATKAFEEHFTLSLAAELAPDRIDCICLRPGITVSRMSGIKDPSFFCPSAKDMAHSIINQISSAGNDVSVVPYFPHSILDYINSFVPQQISWGIVREMHNVKRKLLLEQKTD
jgi:17beta-estradiol 17-dehydrogenase / very-long-chain 3-oxoacyl-CoA reductase